MSICVAETKRASTVHWLRALQRMRATWVQAQAKMALSTVVGEKVSEQPTYGGGFLAEQKPHHKVNLPPYKWNDNK